jgi:hypothetical protein
VKFATCESVKVIAPTEFAMLVTTGIQITGGVRLEADSSTYGWLAAPVPVSVNVPWSADMFRLMMDGES